MLDQGQLGLANKDIRPRYSIIEQHAPATMGRIAEKLYKHSRFYQFRILKLWKGNGGNAHECTLHTATIAHLQQVVPEETDEPLEYEAVSFQFFVAMSRY